MRRYRKWVLTLGLAAAAPSVAMAGPFDFLKSKAEPAVVAPADGQVNNQKVAEEIAAALRKAKLNGYDVEIEYRNGVATLSGKVADVRQKLQATRLVAQVPGVQRVDNKLVPLQQPAGPAGAPTATGPTAPKAPAMPQAAAKPPVASRSPFRGGIQQVNYEAESEAEFFPSSATSSADNQKTAEAIAGALSKAQLSGFDIEIHYQDGTAKLTGTVATPAQKTKATSVVRSIEGVQLVDNQLVVPGERPQPRGGQNPYMSAAYQPGGPMPPAGPPGAAPPGYPPGAAPPGYPGMGAPGVPPGYPAGAPPAPPGYGYPGPAPNPGVYDMPQLPEHAWPTYGAYPNYAAVTYPQQYSASAWPYIGPFYPYPQVPLGWRSAQLVWDDGYWNLKFNSRTDRWWWFLNPHNWSEGGAN